MNDKELDRLLLEEAAGLPPPEDVVAACNPWREAMTRILLGLALGTFRLEFLYLQYLLPLLGAVLLYLGCRSLRESGVWFRLCWVLSGGLLGLHMARDVLGATPVLEWIAGRPALDLALAGIFTAVNVVLLAALRKGVREQFSAAGDRPRDWLGRGLAVYLLSVAAAVWTQLVPGTQPGMIGVQITNEWLYYGRAAAFIALRIYLLVCIYRQGEALAGRGYGVVPAPVRLSARGVVLLAFGLVLAAIPAALFLSCRESPAPETQAAPLTREQRLVRQRLEELGLPETVAAALDGAELERLEGAEQVIPGAWFDTSAGSREVPRMEGSAVVEALGDGEAELSVWFVLLPDGRVRAIHFFRCRALPSLRLQEQFTADPSGYFATGDFAGRLLFDREGTVWEAQVELRLGGGETAEELPEWSAWIHSDELEKFGRLHLSPWFSFAIPRGAEEARGYLSYTISPDPEPEQGTWGDAAYSFLRHQSRLLHYPYVSLDALGGEPYGADYGPMETVWAAFDGTFPKK